MRFLAGWRMEAGWRIGSGERMGFGERMEAGWRMKAGGTPCMRLVISHRLVLFLYHRMSVVLLMVNNTMSAPSSRV